MFHETLVILGMLTEQWIKYFKLALEFALMDWAFGDISSLRALANHTQEHVSFMQSEAHKFLTQMVFAERGNGKLKTMRRMEAMIVQRDIANKYLVIRDETPTCGACGYPQFVGCFKGDYKKSQ